MDSARTKLIKGAVKSASAALAGMSIAGNILDPDKFSLLTVHGVLHTLAYTGVVVGVAEARYFYQWINKWAASDGTLAEALDVAQVKQQQAAVAIEEAKSQVPPKP